MRLGEGGSSTHLVWTNIYRLVQGVRKRIICIEGRRGVICMDTPCMDGATGTTTAIRCTPQAMSSCNTDNNIALHSSNQEDEGGCGKGRDEG